MKRLVLVSALVAVGLLALFVPLERTSEALSPSAWSSGPLLSCPDVNGDGTINLVQDIMYVSGAFGKFGDANYAYLYDVGNGDGVVNIPDDVLYITSRFGDTCTDLIERQIAVATSAMLGRCTEAHRARDESLPAFPPHAVCPDLRNWSEANAAGYIQSTQYVNQMGIHGYNIDHQAVYTRMDDAVCDPAAGTYDVDVCQLEHPVGLVHTESGGEPDQLIGAWYLVPNPEVCAHPLFNHPTPEKCQDPNTEPIGFGTSNEDEDNTSVQGLLGWHDHRGLCLGNWDTANAFVVPASPTVESETNCLDGNFFPCGTGCFFFYDYGWMMHLYDFVPNPVSRFMQWNSNLP